MKCPNCGAENEATNRFCDQCGSRLEPSGASAPAQPAAAPQPAGAGPTCPSCGAAVLPGEAFCDECGASLSGVAVAGATSNDAPTMFAPPRPEGGSGAASDQGLCPACGHQNLPGDRFCDNCGAELGQAGAASAAPTIVNPAAGTNAAANPAPAAPSDEELLRSLNEAPPAPSASSTAQPAAPASALAETEEQPPSSGAPTAAAPPIETAPQPDSIAAADQPTVEQAGLPGQAEYQAERKRLEDEIARQQQIIAQFEQMQATFGAATPAAVTQGLNEARAALTRAQNEFDALKPPAPAIDPAEVARLNDEIARQQQIIAQFEQMQATFGAATPAVVTQGLAEAREAKARVEAELAALGGEAAAPAAPPEAPAAPPVSAVAPTIEAPPVAPPSSTSTAVTEPPAPPPPAAPSEPAQPAAGAPAPAGVPRLVIDESGTELPLPTDKREIIVGREDPISGIFPEIDLTPHGGESGGVSRQHARISHDDGQWTVTDLNSTNYTRVDGTKIDPSVAVPLKDGSRLQFGRVAVTFRQ